MPIYFLFLLFTFFFFLATPRKTNNSKKGEGGSWSHAKKDPSMAMLAEGRFPGLSTRGRLDVLRRLLESTKTDGRAAACITARALQQPSSDHSYASTRYLLSFLLQGQLRICFFDLRPFLPSLYHLFIIIIFTFFLLSASSKPRCRHVIYCQDEH